MSKAEICPVCNGTGIYKEFYNYGVTSECGTQRTCHGCNGKGWVEVGNKR